MALKIIETGAVWRGEKVRGITYSLGIEHKLSDQELFERGLERVVFEEAQPEPEKKPEPDTWTVTI
jgi:hypothetical protein